MTVAAEMLSTYPKDLGQLDQKTLVECIEACLECAQSCTACADACLAEDNVAELTKCIRINMDCADVCATTARILSRLTSNDASLTRATLEACRVACANCADECETHEMHKHCVICAASCRRCEEACAALLATF